MGLLDLLFGKDADPRPKVHEDSMAGLPSGPALLQHAQRGDWRKVGELLASERDAARRWRCVNLAADGLGKRVAQWTKARPADSDAWLVAGVEAINRGAALRGAGKAEDTPDDRWDPFHECIGEAEQFLARATELNQGDALPWVPLLTTAMTLGAPVEERLARFEEAQRRDPLLVAAHVGIMTALTEKWGGSHELMFDRARRSAAEAPAGTSVAAVLPLAHVERWLYIVHWERDEALQREYFRQAAVQREIQECRRKCATLRPESVAWAANVFAFCLHLADDARGARQEFERAAGLYTGLPWDYSGGIAGYEQVMAAVWRRGASPKPKASPLR